MTALIFDVCFTPNIRHSLDRSARRLRANKRHRSRMAAQSAGIVNYSRREAEKYVGEKYTDAVLDSLYVIECSMRHFFIRAEMGKNAGRKREEVDEDYKQAAALAALVAPYRHPRLSAVKVAGDPNNPARFDDNATADELRAELMKRLRILVSAGLIDLKALPCRMLE